MLVALALLFVRSSLSQMDVPTRTAYVMGAVTPAERAAAAGWIALPLIACGGLKIAYDLVLWRAFRAHPPRPE